ncbi:MAG: branched-chain amino acid ABC transporter permease [Alphaproteobacteria bacterium]|nr:branched-chain amino acid ABC transporter permease [Alphaproteobacteria bacterium]
MTGTAGSGTDRASFAASGRVFWLLPLALLGLPLVIGSYVQYIVNLTLVYVLVGVGFNVVLGNLGQLAFANAAFFGIGAYATGTLMYHLKAPFPLALCAGALAGGLAGALVALPALRGIRAFYLAIMTLAFGELMRWIYINADAVTLGSMGMQVPRPTLFGYVLVTDVDKYYVFLAVVTLLVAATANLLRSRVGRAFTAIRDNELAAASIGIPTARYMVLAFAWSGVVVGTAGALYAALVRHVSPEAFNLLELILHFGIVMVGGLASLAGSILGAAVLTAAPEMFRDLPGYEELLIAILMVAVLLLMPKGLASLLARASPLFRQRYFRD